MDRPQPKQVDEGISGTSIHVEASHMGAAPALLWLSWVVPWSQRCRCASAFLACPHMPFFPTPSCPLPGHPPLK